jgi:AcrR family transcriptional regulator
MARKSQPKRDTFRHGNLPEALVDAALERLDAAGVESISLRDLARDAGVNHRAVYRHFPDKLSLLARVAEEGWKRLALRVTKSAANKAPGEPALVACGVGLYLFARDCPNLFHLMAGERINTEGKFPDLEAAVVNALQIFAVGFAGTGMAPDFVIWRASVYMTSLQGIVTQILRRRFYLAPENAIAWMTDTCVMLIRGLKEGPGDSALFRHSDN